MHMHQCTIAHSGKTQGDDNTPISCKISLPMLLLTGRMIEKTNLLFGILLIVAAAFNQATALEQGSTFFIFENFCK